MYYLMYQDREQPRVEISIDRKKCTDCGYCLKACKRKVFFMRDDKVMVRNGSNCNGCRKCIEVCVYDALYIVECAKNHNENPIEDK